MKAHRVIIPVVAVAVPFVSLITGAFYGPAAAIAVFAGSSAAVILYMGWLLYYKAVSRNSDKSYLISAPHNSGVVNLPRDNALRRDELVHWQRRVTAEDAAIRSFDGLDLHAVVIRNNPDISRWVVICHGYAYIGKEHMVFVAQTFHEMGYNVLMPDARGHGQSGGGYIGMGWHDRLDVIRWVDEIIGWDGSAEIVLYGISMGAATVVMASGEPLKPAVKAIVADSGYTSAVDVFAYQMKMIYKLSFFPFMKVSSFVTRLLAGFWLGEASTVRQIAKSATPTLLIHGGEDTFIPPYMLDELYNAAGCPIQRMLIEGANHGQTLIVDRARYWQAIRNFLKGI